MTTLQQGSPFEDTTLEDTSPAAVQSVPLHTELVEGNAPRDPLESDGSLKDSLREVAVGTWQTLPKMFNRKWWLVTLVVIAGVAFLISLGFWQLDRLDQRRAQNAKVIERVNGPPIDLNTEALPTDLESIGYRLVQAEGSYDYANQIVMSNLSGDNGEVGVQLLTPFVLDDGRAVLVARGWVPSYLAGQENWPNLEEPQGTHQVVGFIQQSQELEGSTPPPGPQLEWYTINIPFIQRQMPYELLPAFLLQKPEANQGYEDYPLRKLPYTLDEGSHFSYAIQWFLFAAVLGIGYIQYVRWQDERSARIALQAAQAEVDDLHGMSEREDARDVTNSGQE